MADLNFNFIEPGYAPISYDFNFGEGHTIHTILKGTSNFFTSIWVCNNKMYVGSSDAFTIVDLNSNTVYDFYTETHKGRAGESLNANDTIDINVVG